jgi:hypothetical protein
MSSLSVLHLHSQQPFFAVSDDAYERMYQRLCDGEPFVKSFIGVCPSKHERCSCKYFKNILVDDKMVREVEGVYKPVLSVSMIMNSRSSAS